jgi:hypothetical protein
MMCECGEQRRHRMGSAGEFGVPLCQLNEDGTPRETVVTIEHDATPVQGIPMPAEIEDSPAPWE